MMKNIKRMSKVAVVMALLVTSFSGSIVAVQAAEPWHRDNRWEQRDDRDRWDHRDDRHDRYDRHDRWNKEDEKTKAQKDADEANKKANWALGIAVVAGIIAATK